MKKKTILSEVVASFDLEKSLYDFFVSQIEVYKPHRVDKFNSVFHGDRTPDGSESVIIKNHIILSEVPSAPRIMINVFNFGLDGFYFIILTC